MSTLTRPSVILRDIAQKYPDAWKWYEMFRKERGTGDLPGWPEWCYCPMASAYAIVSGGGDNRLGVESINDVQTLAALAAWRVTQGIYRFDPTLAAAILETPIITLPTEILYRLPEWCVYIEAIESLGIPGFFAYLEFDANTSRQELRFLVDTPDGLGSMILHLNQPTINEAIKGAMEEAQRQAFKAGEIKISETIENIKELMERNITQGISPLLNLVLYLCAENAELGGERPRRPQPTKTKKGLRLFPPDKPRIWDVGFRIGADFRAARLANQESVQIEGVERSSPRPHIRRAHWHTFRVGEKRSGTMLKWLSPILVKISDGEIVPTVREVKKN